MSNGINTLVFEPERREETRQGLYNAIRSQKVNPQDFLAEDPDRPEMDSERQEQLQRLSKVSAIASGIDAVTDAIGVGTSEDYAPAPTNIGQLGVTSFDELARMDQQHRGRLENWRQNVLNTRRANRQTRGQIGQQNAQVDLQVAQQKYQDYMQDAEANRQAEQFKTELEQNEDLNDRQAWRQAGMRLISQGQEKAGVAALGRSGLSTDQIAGMLQGGGTGGVDPQTTAKRNMIQRFRQLEGQLVPFDRADTGAKSDYDQEGNPITPQAREYERLLEEIQMQDLYNPLYQPREVEEPDKEKVFSENERLIQALDGADQYERRQILQDWYENAEQLGMSRQQATEDLDTATDPQSRYNIFRAAEQNKQLVQQIQQSSSPQQRRQYADQLRSNYRRFGMTDQEIRTNFEKLFGQSQQDSTTATNGTQQADADSTETPFQPATGRVPPEESFEEFKERVNQRSIDEFSQETAEQREHLVNILKRMNFGVTKLREIVTSPLWALKQIFNNLSEARQKELYEQYQQEQQQFSENNQ